jgi:subtilisin family serine protease
MVREFNSEKEDMVRKIVSLLMVVGLFVACGDQGVDVGKKTQAVTVAKCAVSFEEGTTEAQAGVILQAAGATLTKYLPQVYIAFATNCDLDVLNNAEGVEGATPTHAHTIEPLSQVHTKALSGPTASDGFYNVYGWDIRRVKADKAWANGHTGSKNTVVAVIDTGVAFNHPDLAPNKVAAKCYNINSLFYGVPCNPYPDVHWHGTHVAGTVAAAFGGAGFVGVGPNLGLASYNVFEWYWYQPPGEPGEWIHVAFDEPLWVAILDAADSGYDVINMSLGSYLDKPLAYYSGYYHSMWVRVVNYAKQKGVTVVTSAGNSYANTNGPDMAHPADLASTISVAATGIRTMPEYPQSGAYDVLAFYSNYGAAVTLSAPGGDCGPYGCGTYAPLPYYYWLVPSTYVFLNPIPPAGDPCALTQTCGLGYAWAGGTSMASPHVAGAAGLLMDAKPNLNPNQVAKKLKQSAENIGPQLTYGAGLLDVEKLLK